ncbi:UNVERIFIED_CONTAM: hypothetical protein FKN15_061491 [Acipenser sinensis]
MTVGVQLLLDLYEWNSNSNDIQQTIWISHIRPILTFKLEVSFGKAQVCYLFH